jgi:hypothetical protein
MIGEEVEQIFETADDIKVDRTRKKNRQKGWLFCFLLGKKPPPELLLPEWTERQRLRIVSMPTGGKGAPFCSRLCVPHSKGGKTVKLAHS